MTRHHQPRIDRCFDIDEPTTDIPPRRRSDEQQAAPEYGKPFDPHRLAAVTANGGWWNPTTQELIPILPEDDPNYRENQEMIAAAIRRWNGSRSK